MIEDYYRPLIAGIDTLEIGYCISSYMLSESEWCAIAEAKESAQLTMYDTGKSMKFRGYDFTVLRTGSVRYKFILSNNDMQIRIFSDAKSGLYFPELRIAFRSPFLWRHGWKDAVRKTDEWIQSWANVIEIKISRIDIMVDFMGQLPILSPELIEVVTRSRKKREFGIYERYAEGKKASGYRFGANELICRIYDKTTEIIRSDKKWFETLWERAGWQQGEPVTRVEFQCRRKMIRQMQIETMEDLFSKMPDLWRELSSDWLTIRIIQNDSHRTRWNISDVWLVVQDAVSRFGYLTGVSRLKQLKSKKDTLEGHARGYLLNLAALASKSLPGADIEYGKRYIEYFVTKILDEPDLNQGIEKRKHKYDSMEY
ncbi:hypothetical protein ACFLU7_00490 [Chloroflexota bacterium]